MESNGDSSVFPIEIDFDDIQEEVDFWNSAVVCYVVGANPPINVMEGFIRRIWKHLNVDKVVLVKRGIYLVRFKTMDSRDKVLTGHYFFDSKPLVLKPWTVDMDMDKDDMKSVPIWVQLKLNFKYWGEKALFKIVSQIGNPIKRDFATACRDKLQYARVLVVVPLSQKFQEEISFRNEKGEMTVVRVHYEWRPTVCTTCRGVGHVSTECRLGNTKRVWVKKQPIVNTATATNTATASVPVENASPMDPEGFQTALRPIRVRSSSVTPTQTVNAFQILESVSQIDGGGDLGNNGGTGEDHGSNVAGRGGPFSS
ncbi:uncharacterized protein [Spinacia oleracea]|uniref:DUF4283 domain-containing protein n=1 Tax=Spinacia oleracea TaxID=3562 RepID=A0A9R0K5S6_SPIOL|nr:uncharacterized protein LOC110797948 [Spinacia oleracea]